MRAGQALGDLADGPLGKGVAHRVALEAGGRLNGVDQGVKARGSGDPGGQGLGHPGVQHRHVGEQMIAEKLHFHLERRVGHHGHQGGLAAGARGGGHRHKGDMGPPGEDLTAGGIQQVAARLGQDHPHPFGGVNHRSAPHGDEAVALGLAVEAGDLVDHLDGGVRGNPAEGLRRRHPPLAEGGLHNLYRPHLLQALVAEQEGAVGPQAVQLVRDVLQGPVPGENFGGQFELIVGGHSHYLPNSTAR